MEKSDRHDQWNVLNLLTYDFDIKDNFEQGGIVPLTLLLQHRQSADYDPPFGPRYVTTLVAYRVQLGLESAPDRHPELC